MFGFEKKKDKSFFTFDLEKELEDDKKQQAHMKHAEKNILELKKHLREGAKSEDFDKLGLLLHGYSALLKVLTQTKIKG